MNLGTPLPVWLLVISENQLTPLDRAFLLYGYVYSILFDDVIEFSIRSIWGEDVFNEGAIGLSEEDSTVQDQGMSLTVTTMSCRSWPPQWRQETQFSCQNSRLQWLSDPYPTSRIKLRLVWTFHVWLYYSQTECTGDPEVNGSLQKNIDCGQNGGSWHIEFHRSEGSYGTDHGQNWHPEHLQLWIPQDGFRLCCHQIAGFPLWGVSSCLRRAVAQCALSITTYLAQDGHRGWSRETPYREGDCRSSGWDHKCITAGQTKT